MTAVTAPNTTREQARAAALPRPRLARPGLLRELLNNVFFIVAALILAEIAFPRSSIEGPSMQPSLFAGQHLLISRVHYLFGDPQRNDIAVFDPDDNKNEMLIKRVIGIPGDVIEFRDTEVERDGQIVTEARLFRNGEMVDEPYFVNAPCTVSSCRERSWTLGEDEYFMMGDNRNHSNDSRSFGPVRRERIVGKAVWRYLPLDQFGSLENLGYNQP